MANPAYVPLRPIPMKDRASIIFLEYGELDVLDSAFVIIDKNGIRTQIPVGGLACLMLEPGTRVGEAAVRLYASGQPGGAHQETTDASGKNDGGMGSYDLEAGLLVKRKACMVQQLVGAP